MNQFNLENEPQFNSEDITLQYIYSEASIN